MKLNENYILKTVAGMPVVVPVGDAAARIHGMITRNAEESVIRGDLDAFLEKLKNFGILE